MVEPVLSFISEHSHVAYPLIFLLTFLEGEAVVLAAGLLASQGVLDAGLIFIAAWLGSFGGDQLMYWVGRCFGPRALGWLRGWRERVESLLPLIRRRAAVLTLSFRFIYGVRNVAAFSIGLSGVEPARFAGLNLLGAGVWALSFVGAGYMFGHAVTRLPHHAAIAGAAAVVVVAIASLVVFQRRRLIRAAG